MFTFALGGGPDIVDSCRCDVAVFGNAGAVSISVCLEQRHHILEVVGSRLVSGSVLRQSLSLKV